MAKHYKTSQSRFFCTGCGREGISIHRKKGQERKENSIFALEMLYLTSLKKNVFMKLMFI